MSILWVAVTVLQKSTNRVFSNNSCLLETAWMLTDNKGASPRSKATRLRLSLLQGRRQRTVNLCARMLAERPAIHSEMTEALSRGEAQGLHLPESEMVALVKGNQVSKIIVDSDLGCPISYFYPILHSVLAGAVCNMRTLRAFCDIEQPKMPRLPRAADQIDRARKDFVGML